MSAIFDHQRALINSLWQPEEGESRLFTLLEIDSANISESLWKVTAQYVDPAGRGRELLWEQVEPS